MLLTESLDVKGELLLVLDERIDLEAVWCGSTLGLAAVCTSYDDVRRHAGCKLEVVENGGEKVGCLYTRMIRADK